MNHPLGLNKRSGYSRYVTIQSHHFRSETQIVSMRDGNVRQGISFHESGFERLESVSCYFVNDLMLRSLNFLPRVES